jgi:ribosomal-protein-alanine N-acetyltransferase
MVEADVERVLALAGCLPEAPHWSAEVYRLALAPEAAERRIALVAESVSEPLKTLPDLPELQTTPSSIPENGGNIVAFAVASLIEPQAELETIAVAAESQRQGVARCLLTELQAELLRSGITEVLLEVRASNRAALALYAALGFRETGLRPRYYIDPVEDALQMTARIG